MGNSDIDKITGTTSHQTNLLKDLRDTIVNPYSYILLISIFETSFNYLRKYSVSIFLVLLLVGFLIQFYMLLKSKALFGLIKTELSSHFIFPMVLFIALLIVSLVGVESSKVGFYFIRSYIGSGMLVFLIATNIQKPEKIKNILTILSFIAVVNALLGILQVYVSSSFYLIPYIYPAKNAAYFNKTVLPHAFGFFIMNFNYGFTLLLGSLNIVSRFINEKRKGWEFFLLMSWGVVLYGYLISFLRSSILAIFLGSAIIVIATLIKNRGTSSGMIKKILAFSIVTLIVPALFFHVHFLNKKEDTVISMYNKQIVKDKKKSDNVRIVLYKLGFEIFRDHPLKGVGIGNYKIEKMKYLKEFKELSEKEFRKLDSHNIFIEVLCGAGIFAFIVFLYMLLFPVFKITKIFLEEKIPDEISVIYILLLAYFTAALFDSNFHNFSFENMHWIGIGLFYSIVFIRRYGDEQDKI